MMRFILGVLVTLLTSPAFADYSGPGLPMSAPRYAVQAGLACSGNTTDVTSAIQTWITANAGNQLVLPAGSCGISSTLIVPANTTLSGLGMGVTTLDASALGKPGMGSVVKLNGNYASAYDFTVKGSGAGTTLSSGINNSVTSLVVTSATGWPTSGPFTATIFADGANSTETVTVTSVSGTTWTVTRSGSPSAHGANALIQSPRADDGVLIGTGFASNKVTRVEVSGAGDNGIETDGNMSEIASNYVYNNYTNGIYHIGQTGNGTISYGARIHDNRLDNNSVYSTTCTTTASPSCWDGIDLDPLTQNDIVADNYVGENDIILFETDAAWSTKSSGHQIIGNKSVNSVAGCLTVAGFVDDFKFVGNQCVNTTGSAITVHGPATNGQFEENSVDGSTTFCAYVYAVASGTYAGVANNVNFHDTTCINTASAGGTGVSPIKIQDSATNILLSHNKVLGTNGGIYAIDTTGASASVSYIENYPLTTGSTGVINPGGTQPMLGQPGNATGSLVGGITSATILGQVGQNSFSWGQSATAIGASAIALGFGVSADQTYSTALGGNCWTKNRYGFHCDASGDFAANGDGQHGETTLRASGTTSSGTVTLRGTSSGTTANANDCINLQNNNWFRTDHVLELVDGTTAAHTTFSLTGAGIYRGANAASTALDGTGFPSWVQGSSQGSTTAGHAASAWAAPTMTADTGNGCVNVSWTSPSETAETFYLIDTVNVTEH